MLKFIKKSVYKKLFVTIVILAIYKFVMLVVIPGVDLDVLPQISSKSGILETLNAFSGGSIDNCSILATNIMPYITATIITQMFSSKSLGIEYFQNLKKDKELGDAKKNEWTQYFTVIISAINAIYLSYSLIHSYRGGMQTIFISPWLFYFISVPAMIAGTMFVVWLSNQISKHGIGQGTSVIIFANIVSNSASSFNKIYTLFKSGQLPLENLIQIMLFFFCLFFIVIYVEACNLFLPVRYSGIKGKTVYQKLPLKINNAGVMPAVLSSSFAHFPAMLSGLLEKISFNADIINKYASYISNTSPLYYIITSVLIFMFTVTQSEVSFDPEDIAQNLQDSGAVIKDVRPGENTYKLLANILGKLNFLAGIFLIFVCVFSEYFCNYINNLVGERILQFGGTSVLILVSTSKLLLDGVKQYNYEGLVESMED